MPTFIVCTNFSETSRNALNFACSLIQANSNVDSFDILLLHVFTIPANYSGDGIALFTINNGLNYAEEDLNQELIWAEEEYPNIAITGKVTTGRLVDELQQQVQETQASLVIIGTGGNYGELFSWDNDILTILRHLSVPVLTIPPSVKFSTFQNIAFACNLKNVNRYTPFPAIRRIIELTKAKLHLVYVSEHEIKPGSPEYENQLLVRQNLHDLHPQYHELHEHKVVGAIGRFIEDQQIQLLLVMPKRYGVWENLFHKNYTKELARLNKLPIMALH